MALRSKVDGHRAMRRTRHLGELREEVSLLGGEEAGAEEGDGAALAVAAYAGKLLAGALLLVVFETSIAKMRVFRVPDFLGIALMLGLLATLLRFVSRSL